MKLSKFKATHFRCLYNGQDILFHPITVLIGENDGGKTATLRALSLFFSRNANPDEQDYSFITGTIPEDGNEAVPRENTMTLEAEFELEEAELQQVNDNILMPISNLRIRKIFETESTPKIEIASRAPIESRLRIDPDALTLPQIRTLAEEFDIPLPGGTTKDPNVVAFKQWLREQPMEEAWSPAPQQVITMLPEYELVSGSSEPESLIYRILLVTYRDELQKEENRQLLARLESSVSDKLQEKASTLKQTVQKYVSTIREVLVDPQFSFDGGFKSAPLQLIGQNGRPIYLSMRGAGLKQQITMATYEWSSDVLEARQQESARPLILGFDEPDIHLDYKAQRNLYSIISGFVSSNIQVIIATHSINFINRVPIHQINHYSLSADHSHSIVECLQTSDDVEEREFFLNELGRAMGLENTTMFYERCFLTFEGKTEEGALPRLFEICVTASTHARGVKLINGYDNYGAVVFAKFIHRNNRKVLFMVDEDTTLNKGTSRHLTPQALEREGFPIEQAHIIQPGCFEFAFSDEVWSRVLTRHQYQGEKDWTLEEISSMRKSPKEFIKAIENVLQEKSKPRIGVWLSEAIRDESEIPESIKECLLHADRLANPT